MPNPQRYDIAVIGTGPAGQRAAVQAAKAGKRVVAIDRRQHVGGQAVHRGTIPSKTLREAVMHLTGVDQRAFYGRSYRVTPNITMPDLMRRTSQVVQAEVDLVQDAFIRNGIELRTGTAHFVGLNKLAIDTDTASEHIYPEKIIIATGSNPARPTHIPFNESSIVDTDGILDLEHLPKTITIVGAGVIGCEYASIFSTLGVQVTLIDGRNNLLDFVDDEITEALRYRMRADGITLRLGHNVTTVECDERGRAVAVLETGARIVSSILMYSVGRHGTTHGLGLEKADLAADQRGRLHVNEYFQTAAPHIYAVGDVIGNPQLAATSAEQGRLAARHAVGIQSSAISEKWPIGIYTIPEIAMVGKTENALTRDGIAYETGIGRYSEVARGAIVGDDFGVVKVLFSPEDRSILGVHIFGSQASELLHIGQAVMELNGTIDYFVDTIFNYPTFAEAYKIAGLNGLNKLLR